MNYTSPKSREKDSEIQIEEVINFFVNFIEMDQLGRIANAHVAISDQSKFGVKDPVCIQLANAFSLAVDFPKTGVLAQLPVELKKSISQILWKKMVFATNQKKSLAKCTESVKVYF